MPDSVLESLHVSTWADCISTVIQLWVVNVRIYVAHSHAIFNLFQGHMSHRDFTMFKVAKTDV